MSSQTRQRFPLYQVQCRVKLDTAFRCTRSIVELDSTALSVVPGQVSSQTRQRFPLYQVQCRVDMLYYNVLRWFFQNSCPIIAAFEIGRVQIFWKINMDKTVQFHVIIILVAEG